MRNDVSAAQRWISYRHGNVKPERAFTVEISEESIDPVAFRSNRKLVAFADCPERAFMALMSLEFTERVLLTSPTRKPIETASVVRMQRNAGTVMCDGSRNTLRRFQATSDFPQNDM